jgi:hypothetical protein
VAATISWKAASELAARLDLDVDQIGICHACLSFVSFPLRRGDEDETERATQEFTPDLWEEGLAEPVRAALERARAARVPAADEALADVEALGGRSLTARAIVQRLARDLWEWAEGDLFRMGWKPWPPAEWN